MVRSLIEVVDLGAGTNLVCSGARVVEFDDLHTTQNQQVER